MEPHELIGKHLLIGLTYLDADGEVAGQYQLHGLVTRADHTVIYLEQANGEGEFSIPFDPELEPGVPGGVYRLRSTGESVENVDFVSSWTIHAPAGDEA